MIDVDDLPVVYGIEAPTGQALASLRAGGAPLKPPAPAMQPGNGLKEQFPEVEAEISANLNDTGRKLKNKAGWVRGKKPDCFFGGLGLWICAVCVKLGRDYRRIMCPFGGGA